MLAVAFSSVDVSSWDMEASGLLSVLESEGRLDFLRKQNYDSLSTVHII